MIHRQQWTVVRGVCFVTLVMAWNSTIKANIVTYKFLTGPLYKNYVLDATPYWTRWVGSIQECQALCSARARCKAVAFGMKCTPVCLMYDTNACLNSMVGLKALAKFTIWDKVDSKAIMACKDLAKFRSCIYEKVDRCGGCDRVYFHGEDCQYARRGCPGKYQFHDGQCSLIVTGNRLTYSAIDQKCASLNGGRFAVVRNAYANRMLTAWLKGLKSQNLATVAFIGIDRLSDQQTYWRKDGLLISDTFKAFARGEPSALMQNSVSMMPVVKGSYYDDLPSMSYYFICQVRGNNCNLHDEWKADSQNCYYLHRTSMTFENAAKACAAEYGGTLAAVRDIETHELLMALMTEWNVTGKVYIGIKTNMTLTWYMDGTKVTFPESLWGNKQPNHLNETVVYLNNNGQWYDELDGTARDYVCEYIATSCSEWYEYGHRENHTYRLLPLGSRVDVQAYCDMTSFGGGWTVIQARRGNRSVSFNRTLKEYNTGFGDVNSDYWLGNEHIFLLTNQEQVKLRIEMVEADGTRYSVAYSPFNLIRKGTYQYSLQLGVFNNVGGLLVPDHLRASEGALLSTFGNDSPVGHCVQDGRGGWWFTDDCNASVNLNGPYPNISVTNAMSWVPGRPLVQVVMKIRPINFNRKN